LVSFFTISCIFYYFWFCLFDGRDEALGEGGGFGEALQEAMAISPFSGNQGTR